MVRKKKRNKRARGSVVRTDYRKGGRVKAYGGGGYNGGGFNFDDYGDGPNRDENGGGTGQDNGGGGGKGGPAAADSAGIRDGSGGVPNSGGGAGGGSAFAGDGGDGGTGIVIIRYEVAA